MADIDMIPRSYRDALRVRRAATAYGIALGLLLLAGASAGALLRWRVAVESPRLEQLRAGSVQADAMRAQLELARQRRDAYAQDVAALAAVRGAGEVTSLANILDASLNDQVWIEQLRFSRTEEQLPPTTQMPLPAGTVQVRATQTPGTVQIWRLGSRIEIAGQARDHAAMTAFLTALASNPALSDVRFMNSAAAPAEDGSAVSFGASASLIKQGETP
ncbi:MAG: PilN domain-containing protein [Telluria sp.]